MTLLQFKAFAFASITWTALAAVAFVPPEPHLSCRKAEVYAASRADALPVPISDSSAEQLPLPLSPRDNSWNPVSALQELQRAPDIREETEHYDKIGVSSGGTWRSCTFGLLPSTVR